jgi:hypothetical protein
MTPSTPRALSSHRFHPSLTCLAAIFAGTLTHAAEAAPPPEKEVPSSTSEASSPADAVKSEESGEPADTNARTDDSVPPSPGKRPENGYWSVGEPRFFVSTKSDIGTPYLKPYFSAGYGVPHWIWGGVDVNTITTLEFTQVYAGVRAASPVFDLAFGVRDTWSFQKPFLPRRKSFSRSDVLDSPGPPSRYWAWEAEAVGIIPLPYSAIVADFIMVKTLDAPDGAYLYEESYRAVVGKPFYCVLRLAAVARILREGALKVGPLVEHVFETARDAPVWRVGPAASFQITDHLEAQGVLTLAVSSPDPLGLVLGAYGVAGLRYRWATGERRPRLPWQEEIIP